MTGAGLALVEHRGKVEILFRRVGCCVRRTGY